MSEKLKVFTPEESPTQSVSSETLSHAQKVELLVGEKFVSEVGTEALKKFGEDSEIQALVDAFKEANQKAQRVVDELSKRFTGNQEVLRALQELVVAANAEKDALQNLRNGEVQKAAEYGITAALEKSHELLK